MCAILLETAIIGANMKDNEHLLIDDFLTEDELFALTGYKMKIKQKEFLETNKIRFYMTGGSRPKPRVLRKDLKEFLQ